MTNDILPGDRTVTINGQEYELPRRLTRSEAVILSALVDKMPRAASHDYLIDTYYGPSPHTPANERMIIGNCIRQNLRPLLKDTGLTISAISGYGYALESSL